MRFKAAQAKSEGDQSAIKEIWVSKMAHHGCMVNKWYVSINKKNKKSIGHNVNFVRIYSSIPFIYVYHSILLIHWKLHFILIEFYVEICYHL